jgi:hypothetical protein
MMIHSSCPASCSSRGTCHQLIHEYSLVAETPEIYRQHTVAEFIQSEVDSPNKQWVASILGGTQEQEAVVVRTGEFVLLPDTEKVNKYWNPAPSSPRKGGPAGEQRRWMTLNWLSIVQDQAIRSLRDLRGEHVPMLRRMLDACVAAIERETGIPQDQVMAYIHYPPSVYQLHVHFSFPYGQYYHRNAYRVHNLRSIIDNLELDADYYKKITLYMAIPKKSMYGMALTNGHQKDPAGIEEPLETSGSIKAAPAAHVSPPTRKRLALQNSRWQVWSHSRVWSTLAT